MDRLMDLLHAHGIRADPATATAELAFGLVAGHDGRRTSDELKKLGIDLHHTTINRIIQYFRKKGRIAVSGIWSRYLKTYEDSMFAEESEGSGQVYLGIAELTMVAAQANAFAERVIGTIRRKALACFILPTERQIRNIVSEYIDGYNKYSPHQGLGSIPNGAAIEIGSDVKCDTTGYLIRKWAERGGKIILIGIGIRILTQHLAM